MLLSVFAASAVGLVGLIAKGYGLLTYAFIALLVLPVLTIGRLEDPEPHPSSFAAGLKSRSW